MAHSIPRFHGSIPALVTPFKQGAVDHDALARFVEWQISQGSHGLVPVGTTGESPTLSHQEHYAVFKTVIDAAAGRAPVIAGCGSNDTATAQAHLAAAEALGNLGDYDAALQTLKKALQHDAPLVRLAAMNVLDRFGQHAKPALPAIRAAGLKKKDHVADYVNRMAE